MARLLIRQRIEGQRHCNHGIREQRIAERVEASDQLTEIRHDTQGRDTAGDAKR